MTKLTLGEAATLYRKSRATLYRHVSKGKLSAEKSSSGGYVVDMAELMRVYGEPPAGVAGDSADATLETSATVYATAPMTALQAEISVLQEKLRASEAAVVDKDAQVVWLRSQVETTQRLLADQRRPRGLFWGLFGGGKS